MKGLLLKLLLSLILLVFVEFSATANDLEQLKMSAKNTLIKWQYLQQGIEQADDNSNKKNNNLDNSFVSQLRADYQQALSDELQLFHQLVNQKATTEYQNMQIKRTFEVEYTHQCKRMSNQQECEEQTRLVALDLAAKQGSSIIINSTTDIETSRNDVDGKVSNSSEFTEKTNMQSFTNISAYKIIESHQVANQNNYQKLWFIKLLATVSNNENSYLFQQLIDKFEKLLEVYLSNNQITTLSENNMLQTLIERVNNVKFLLVNVPQGQFEMGSNQGEFNEKPTSLLTVNSFYIAQTEVTQGLYLQCIKAMACQEINQSHVLTETNLPQTNVSWYNIQLEFIPWLNAKTGKSYRLPTEVEWEYAARATTTSDYYFGNNSQLICKFANGAKSKNFSKLCVDGYERSIADVKQFVPNKFGLYDMLGNAAEWVGDCWHLYDSKISKTVKPNTSNCKSAVVRGGSWYEQPYYLRSSSRLAKNKSSTLDTLGFRLVLEQ